jgi:hypothetical protein
MTEQTSKASEPKTKWLAIRTGAGRVDWPHRRIPHGGRDVCNHPRREPFPGAAE